jgi:hypothetical protein
MDVHPKVRNATIASTAVGVAIAVLNALVAHSELLGSLPTWLQTVFAVVVPPLVTFLAGYRTPSAPRSTLDVV